MKVKQAKTWTKVEALCGAKQQCVMEQECAAAGDGGKTCGLADPTICS